MEGAVVVYRPVAAGDKVVQWIVQSGALVDEGKVIAHLRTPGAADARIGYDDELRAPIAGRLEVLDDDQRVAGGNPAAIAVLRFCTHEMLVGGKLCITCGADVSRYPERTRKAIAQWQAKQRDSVAVKLLPLLPARGRGTSRPAASSAGAAAAAAGASGGRPAAMTGGAASVPARMATSASVTQLTAAASVSAGPSTTAGFTMTSSLTQLMAAVQQPTASASTDARAVAHATGAGAAATAGAAAPPTLLRRPLPGAVPFRGPPGATTGPAFENLQKVHGHGGLAIHMTHNVADQTDAVLQARLKRDRRLVLVLDLDHTLIHATDNLAAAAALQGSPRYASDLHVIRCARSAYAIKLRPGVHEFLKTLAPLYELHIDTKAEREYAELVARVLDPTGQYFGLTPLTAEETAGVGAATAAASIAAAGLMAAQPPFKPNTAARIVSRSDYDPSHVKAAQWLHRGMKDDSMTVILDDTAQVWSHAPNLIHIEAFHYWKGRDVNNAAGASAIDAGAPAKPAGAAASQPAVGGLKRPRPSDWDSEHSADTACSAASASTGDADDSDAGGPAEALRRADAAARECVEEKGGGETLLDVMNVLVRVHREYYQQLDAAATASGGAAAGAAAAAAGARTVALPAPGVPKTAAILQSIRREVLQGVGIVFSHVFPLGIAPTGFALYRNTLAFGALIADNFPFPAHVTTADGSLPGSAAEGNPELTVAPVTHVVSSSAGTAKVVEGLRSADVRVVHLAWLQACLLRYRRVPESDYPLDVRSGDATTKPQDARVAAVRSWTDAISSAKATQAAAAPAAVTAPVVPAAGVAGVASAHEHAAASADDSTDGARGHSGDDGSSLHDSDFDGFDEAGGAPGDSGDDGSSLHDSDFEGFDDVAADAGDGASDGVDNADGGGGDTVDQ